MRKPVMVIAVLASTLILASGGIAFAKGPESVTITGPGIESPIELMDAVSWPIVCDESCPPDPMVRLMEQTGLWYATGDLPAPLEEPVGKLGPGHTLTWIISGPPLIWNDPIDEVRTIRQTLYLYAEDGPVIHTPAQEGLEGWGPSVIGWFTAPDGLLDTLAALGVPDLVRQSNSGVPISNKTTATSADTEPADRFRYVAMGLALIGLVWAARRRSTSA